MVCSPLSTESLWVRTRRERPSCHGTAEQLMNSRRFNRSSGM
jgi:hypothetical protein